MTDKQDAGIVDRLRQAGNDYTIEWGNGDLYDEAADEIEHLRAALAAQPAEAQPTGQSPCARHCEAPAFEGEIRRLKRELQTQAERIRVLREALELVRQYPDFDNGGHWLT